MTRIYVIFSSKKHVGEIVRQRADDLTDAAQIIADLAKRGFTGLNIVMEAN